MVTRLLVFFIIMSTTAGKNQENAKKSSSEKKSNSSENVPSEKEMQNLADQLQVSARKKGIKYIVTTRGLEIVMENRLLFASGDISISAESFYRIKPLLQHLKSLPQQYAFAIEGHTDDQPIHSGLATSNWHLSALRALKLANLLMAEGISPSYVWIEAYGAERPLKPNRTKKGIPIAANQQENRRAVIRIVKLNK